MAQKIETEPSSLGPDSGKPRRTIAFRILLLLIPVAFFCILEMGLRLFGYGVNLDLFVDLEKNPAYWITNPAIGRRYFQRHDFLPATSYDAFPKKKAENTYRIFVLGGSTAAGFPYFHNGAFSRQLKTRLQERYAGLRVEVINLALPAVNSYTLLDFADEIVDHAPDAVLIYAGHNEFYGAFGSGSTEFLGTKRLIVQTYLALQHLRVVQALRDMILAIRTGANEDNRTLMARMVGQQEIPYGGTVYRNTLATFRENLSEIIEIFQSHDIKIVISELVSNLGGQAPFVSSFSNASDRGHWQDLYDKGEGMLNAGNADGAIAFFEQALAIDDLPAKLHFQLARALQQARRPNEARAAFVRAKDLDALRFRASEEFNQMIRDLCSATAVPVVPMIPAFSQASPLGLIGDDLMLDHLHPNLRGYAIMAKAFYVIMENSGFFPPGQRRGAVRPDEYYFDRIPLTVLDQELADIRIKALLSDWPFAAAKQNGPTTDSPKDRIQELAQALWREEISWDEAHLQMAQHFEANGAFENAALEYQAVVAGMPYVVAPYLRLGLTYLNLERLDEARAVFGRSLAVERTALAQKWLGSIYIHKNQTREGIDFLSEALRLEPGDPEILFNLSVGYAKRGNYRKALEYGESLVKDHPDYPGSKEHLQRLRATNLN